MYSAIMRGCEYLYEAIAVGVVVQDAGGVVTYVNKSACEILGLDRSELVGRTSYDDVWRAAGEDGEPLPGEKHPAMVSLKTGKPVKDFVMCLYTDRLKSRCILVSAEPIINKETGKPEEVISTFVDITQRRREEELHRHYEKQARRFYRETILSVTDGKLSICDPPDVERYWRAAERTVDVKEDVAVAGARHEAASFCGSKGLSGERLESYIIAVGEAVTNAVKHGDMGIVRMGSDEESVWVGVTDRGTGIESLVLPRAVLRRGFSTKPSLGLGFSIILDVCDQVLLETSEHGTTVVLVLNLRDTAVECLLENLPVNWD